MAEDRQRLECAEYIASMCEELAKMAKRNGFELGSTLLQMAHIEFKERHYCLDSRVPDKQES